MHMLNNYCFDDERMIIIPGDSIPYKDIIERKIKKNDKYKESYQRLVDAEKRAFTSEQCLPISAGVAITNNCQLRCRYCINGSEDGCNTKNSMSDIKALIDLLIKNIKIRSIVLKQGEPLTMFFTGAGEPTYDWNLFKETVCYLHNMCEENGIECSTSLTTNGVLDDEQIQFIAENISNVMVSFDGLPDIQDRNRPFADGTSSSTYVLHTLYEFDRLKVQYSIRSTVWHKDFNRLNEMVEFIYGNFHNFTNWSVNPVISGGRAINYGMKICDELDKKFITALEEMDNIISKKYCKNNGHVMFLPSSSVDLMCGAMYMSVLWLYPDGELKVCVDGGEYSPLVGSVKQGKVLFNKMFDNDLYVEYRKRFDECRQCLSFRLCAGGCPVKFLRKNNLCSAEWECKIIKQYWKSVLDAIAQGNSKFGWSGELQTVCEEPHVDIFRIKLNNEYIVTYEGE